MRFTRILRFAAPWLLTAVLVLAGGSALLPPSPVPGDAPATAFSAERAMEHVRVIALEPRPMGSQALADVRAYLVGQLESLGLEWDLQPFEAPSYYGGGEPVAVVNLVARIPGTASTRAVALMAHYDTVPTTPGANDDAAAVATLLETARAIRAGPALENDLLLFFTDGEEPRPRHGANALAGQPGTLDAVGLVVNFEASGCCGASALAETSGPERWLVEELATACRPAAFSCVTETSRLMGDIGTDFDCFRNAGIPGFHFVYLHESPVYHTPADDVDAVSLGSLQHHGSYAVHVARRFGGLDLSAPRPEERAVYFRAGPFFVHYPATWALPLAVAAALLFVPTLGRRRRMSARSDRRPVVGLLREAAAGLLALAVGTLAWLGLVALRATPGVLESYVYLLGIVLVCSWIAGKTAPRTDEPSALLGPGLLVLLALLTAVWLPGWSYLFAWPVLAAGVVQLVPGERVAWLRFAVVAATTTVVMTPAVALFFQFAQPRPGNPGSEMPSVIALPLLLALLSVGLLRTVWPRRRAPSTTPCGR